MSGKLLIVDDDVQLARQLSLTMAENGWTVEHVANGTDGLQLLRNFNFDFILLDWNMPGLSGVEVCREFRASGGTTPIIFLTGRNQITDKETGLDVGGDDYLTKPFDVRELLARIRTIQRRAGAVASGPLKIKELKLDAKLHTVWNGERSVRLSATETNILEFLMINRNAFFTAPAIFEALWPAHSSTSEDTVRVHMKYLRSKLAQINAEHHLETVRGAGYIIRDDNQGRLSEQIENDQNQNSAQRISAVAAPFGLASGSLSDPLQSGFAS